MAKTNKSGVGTNPNVVGPAKMWKFGSPSTANTPMNKNLMTRGTMNLGGKSAYKNGSTGATNSPNGTFVLKKKG